MSEIGSDRGDVIVDGRSLHTRRSEVSGATAQTAGMRRYEAISGTRNGAEDIWMGESRMAPGTASANHHHGESETAIYVVRGHPVFVFLSSSGEHRVQTEPGDYVYVPPHVHHREENPAADEEAVVVVARTTQEAIVVNLPDAPAAPPE